MSKLLASFCLCSMLLLRRANTFLYNAKQLQNSLTRRNYSLVIVESPTKAKTIENYLNQKIKVKSVNDELIINGNNKESDEMEREVFEVVACYGHIYDIPASTRQIPALYKPMGIDVKDDFKVYYTVPEEKKELVDTIVAKAKLAEKVHFATDPDREGEAMAHHLNLLIDQPFKCSRVTFNEITKQSILHAFFEKNSEEGKIDMKLVEAQETRKILDRMVGYMLSPLLWKIKPKLSAGRVQSVGLALMVERELERLAFIKAPYFDLQANFTVANKSDGSELQLLDTRLSKINDRSIANGGDFNNKGEFISTEKFYLNSSSDAESLQDLLQSSSTQFYIGDEETSIRNNSPPKPLTTSVLQQIANTQLGYTIQRTMSVAQQLYEKGYITYMRTDSSVLSKEAEAVIADIVGNEEFNNQESIRKEKLGAHEAIRPSIQDGKFMKPSKLKEESLVKLYELIYRRTLQSRMQPQVVKTHSMDLKAVFDDRDFKSAVFRTSWREVLNPGWTKLNPTSSSSLVGNHIDLQSIKSGDSATKYVSSLVIEHMTNPPSRYTEASFVKTLERLGVGRPSTYVSTLTTLKNRNYCVKLGSSLAPTLIGFPVFELLKKFDPNTLSPDLTAQMELMLDRIANEEYNIADEEYDDEEEDTCRPSQQSKAKPVNNSVFKNNGDSAQVKKLKLEFLKKYYSHLQGVCAGITSVVAEEARKVNLPSLQSGDSKLDLFVGPFGPYIKAFPNDIGKEINIRLPETIEDVNEVTLDFLESLVRQRKDASELDLGSFEGSKIQLQYGRYGPYIALTDDVGETVKNVSVPRNVTLDRNTVLKYLKLPIELKPSSHNEPGAKSIFCYFGPYGEYLKYNNRNISITGEDIFSLTYDKAFALVNAKSTEKVLGTKNGVDILLKKGRYGPYIKFDSLNLKIPKDLIEDIDSLTEEIAVELVEKKLADPGSKVKRKKELKGKGTARANAQTKPKRPKSAYLHFCDERRPLVAENVQGLGKISKELADLWAKQKDRSKFEELAAESKRKYEEEMILFESSTNNGKKSISRSRSPKKSASKVVSKSARTPTAYMLFCSDKRAEYLSKGEKLSLKDLGSMWQSTDQSTKDNYTEKSNSLKND